MHLRKWWGRGAEGAGSPGAPGLPAGRNTRPTRPSGPAAAARPPAARTAPLQPTQPFRQPAPTRLPISPPLHRASIPWQIERGKGGLGQTLRVASHLTVAPSRRVSPIAHPAVPHGRVAHASPHLRVGWRGHCDAGTVASHVGLDHLLRRLLRGADKCQQGLRHGEGGQKPEEWQPKQRQAQQLQEDHAHRRSEEDGG